MPSLKIWILKMECPICSSNNTQRLEVVFDSGYHEYEGNDFRDLGGESISNLAKKAAPPQKLPYIYPMLLIIFAIWLIVDSNLFQFIIGILLLGGGVYGVRLAFKFNRNKWKNDYALWKQKWFCHKCGNIYL